MRVFPRKGRGTGGVRCQRLLKSEVGIMAAAVAVDVGGCDRAGAAVALPAVDPRRDGSGVPVSPRLAHVGGALQPPSAEQAGV